MKRILGWTFVLGPSVLLIVAVVLLLSDHAHTAGIALLIVALVVMAVPISPLLAAKARRREARAGRKWMCDSAAVRRGTSAGTDEQQDWRLEAELDVADHQRSLHDLVGHFRGPDVTEEARASVPRDVVVTHDGKLLFAYAADETTIKAARDAIEYVLRHDGIDASIRLSHWDDELDDWHQTDPPPTAQQQRADDAQRRDAETIETRTLVASVGKEIRAEFEQSMLNSASELDVECKIIEHPHLLTTQVGFTVTGSKRKIAEFVQGLTAEERMTFRTDRAVMLSPL